MSEPVVTVRRAGAVLYLTLNRPQARNAMSMAMVLALREALAAAEADGTLRVVVLRGAGGISAPVPTSARWRPHACAWPPIRTRSSR